MTQWMNERFGVSREFVVGAVAMAVTAAILIFNYTGTLTALFTGSGTETRAVFKNSATLRKGHQVRVHGVRVGEVKKVEPLPGGRGSLVTMDVDESAGPLFKDARARVAWLSILGGTFAVEIDPGHPRAGEMSRRVIGVNYTETQVELDDVTSVLEGDARSGLRTLLHELPHGLGEPGLPKQLLSDLAEAAPDVARGVGALRGQQLDKDLRTLVSATAQTVKALDDPGAMRSVVSGAATTVMTTAAREADLRRTLSRAPAVMANTNQTLARLNTTLDLAEPLVERLEGPAGDLEPTLIRLRPLVDGLDRLLGNARPLLRDLRPAVRSLAGTARQGVPLLDDIGPSLERLDETVLPYLAEIHPETKHSTAAMIGPGAGGLALVAAQLDQNGHFLRFPATAGNASFYLPCQTYAGDPNKAKLFECNNLKDTLQKYLEYDPFAPAPGSDPDGGSRKRRSG